MGKVIHIKRCPRCNSKGKVRWVDKKDTNLYPSIVPCPLCKGRGMLRYDPSEPEKTGKE